MKSIEDFLYPILGIYNKLPLQLRNAIGILYRFLPTKIRYGTFYRQYMVRVDNFAENNKRENEKKTERLLLQQINFAIEKIPYYKKFSILNNVNELYKLPIITKDIINKNPSLFITKNLEQKSLKSNTGGSSGSPFTFFIEKGVTRPKEAAHFNQYWGNYGYHSGDRVLMIRGKSLRDNADYELQTIGNKLVISCYNLNQDSIGEIHAQIQKFKPKFIHAYPSSLLTFTKEFQLYLGKNAADFNVQSIFLGSEKLDASDQFYFENFYQTKVITWYGHSECLIHGAKCEISGDYHFSPFYGYLELVDENDKIINIPGTEGKIIATGFDNKVMPLIRYDTGDLGVYCDSTKCKCGFEGKSLSKIVGRGKDLIILRDLTKITLTAFIFGQHHSEFDRIKEIQLIQNEAGHLIVKIVPLNIFSIKDQEKLKQKLISSVKNNLLSIKIELVEKTEKTHRGKHKLLIQNIDI
jgi:phenylacetate-CoA ligase